MSRIIRCKQQSDLWNAARRGRITGSGLGKVMAPPTTRASERKGVKCPAGTEAMERSDYREDLVIERVYGRAVNHYVTRAMEDGAEREPFARMLYEADTQQVVELVGFALHPKWDWFGSSADGLVGDVGGVELKCPTEKVHDRYWRDVSLLIKEYQWQVVGNMICFPEREWWDLVSFHPYAPEQSKLVQFRFYRSDIADTIRAVEEAIEPFNAEIEAEIARRGLPPTVFDIMPQDEPEDDYDHNKSFADQDHSYLDSGAKLLDAI